MAEPCWGRESQWHALHAHECRGNKKDTARPEAEQKGGRRSRSDPFRPVRKKWSFLEKSGHFLEKSGYYVKTAASDATVAPADAWFTAEHPNGGNLVAVGALQRGESRVVQGHV